jgi:hypothetical protein
MSMTAAITRQLHDILDPHATGKQSHRQEETNDEYRNQHENPGHRFESTVTKSLEDAGTAHDEPPENRIETAGQQMVDYTRSRDQKYGSRGLTEFYRGQI